MKAPSESGFTVKLGKSFPPSLPDTWFNWTSLVSPVLTVVSSYICYRTFGVEMLHIRTELFHLETLTNKFDDSISFDLIFSNVKSLVVPRPF